jgi:uncharacterized membrane protein
MVTYFFIRVLFRMIDGLLGPTIIEILSTSGLHFIIPGVGFILTILIIFAVGLASTNVIGKKIFERFEIFLDRIPLVKSIYSGAKQVIHTIATANKASFSRVVLIQFPSKGLYTIGFITGDTHGEINHIMKSDMVNVFMATVPNPTTGFFLMIPKEDVIPLSMSIEDGIKIIMSGGIIVPEFNNKIQQSKAPFNAMDSNKLNMTQTLTDTLKGEKGERIRL